MVHEVPDKERFFKELKSILNKNGHIFIVEPLGHVSAKDFETTMNIAAGAGFIINRGFKLSLGRIAVLTNV